MPMRVSFAMRPESDALRFSECFERLAPVGHVGVPFALAPEKTTPNTYKVT